MVCGFLAAGISIFTLTVLSDTAWVKESLLSSLEQTLGGPIQVETLNLDLFPSPAIDVEGLVFETQTPSPVAFRTKRMEVGIGWQSLWQKNLLVNHIIIDEPDVTLAIPLFPTSEEPITEPIPAIRKMSIRNGQVHFLRQAAGQTTHALNLEAVDLTISEGKTNGPYSIQFSAHIPDPQRSSALTLHGTLTLLEPLETSPIDKESALNPAMEIQGQVQASHLNLGRLVQFANGQTFVKPIHTEANIQGNFSYSVREERDVLEMESFRLGLDSWSFSGKGRIADLFQETPELTFSGTSTPLALEQLPTLLPHDWVPVEVQTFIQDHQVVGSLALEHGSFQVSLNEKTDWEAKGIVRVKDGQFLPRPGQPLLTGVSGSVTFSPSTLQFSQVHGTIAPLSIIAPEATVKLEEHSVHVSVPTFQIMEKDWNLAGRVEFTSRENAPSVLSISGSALPISIQRLSNIIPGTWLPDSIGTTLTELEIDGDLELLTGSVKWIGDEANTVMPEGVIRVTNGQVQIDPNHPPLTHLSGGIVFDSNLIRILEVKATMEASKAFVKEATLEWKDTDIWLDIYSHGVLDAHDVYQALLRDPHSAPLSEPLSLYNDAQGKVHITTHIQGPLTNPSHFQILAGNLLLDDLHLFPGTNGLPLRKLNGELAFDNKGIRIQQFNAQLGDSPVDIKGQWSFQKDSQASNLTFTSSLASNDLQTLLPSIRENFSTLEGPIETSVTFSGSTLRPMYQANVDFTDTTVTIKGLLHKPSGIPADFNAKGIIQENQAVRMRMGTLSIPPYILDVQGHLSWADPPYIRGIVQTESGTGSMLPPGVIIGDGTLNLSSLGITWGLEGKNWDWTTWSMKGQIEGSNRTAESTTSNTNEDVQSVSFQWMQKNQKGKGEITLSSIPIESLLGPRASSPPPLTGATSLKTSLLMRLENPEIMLRSLTGKGNIHLQNGQMQTGPVLSKILSILNVQSVLMGKVNLSKEGLPFDELTGDYSIDKGLLTTENLALKSPVLKLTAAGSYDLPSGRLDSRIAVSPFGAYSNLLKDIPLFGSLMKGERKGFLTALFEVKGPRNTPEVTYLPLESVTGGLKGLAQFPIDVLKNIIPFPLSKKETTEQSDPTK